MFERFTEHARQVVVLAQDEARALKHNYLGTEHLLLGLLREQEGVVGSRVLASFGITLDEVRAKVVRIVGQGDEVVTGQIPFTKHAALTRSPIKPNAKAPVPRIAASSAQFTAWKLTPVVDDVEYSLTSATIPKASEIAAVATCACQAPIVGRRCTASAKATESGSRTQLTCSSAMRARPGELVSIKAMNAAIEPETATKATPKGTPRRTSRP